jgi:aromatic-L-amino-acid/L-tryptophan decarboxylase
MGYSSLGCNGLVHTMGRMSSADRMHVYDPKVADLVLDYVRERLTYPETTLDGLVDREIIAGALDGLIGAEPTDPHRVMQAYADVLSLTILSADSPRYHAFIPAAPTKASLLFDMVVSAASLQGCSILEAAGAVAAENQALRVLADLAGMPSTAGGVFVSGGSAGNLSALVVARDVARHRRDDRRTRFRVVVSDQAHSSISSALNIVDLDALIVPTVAGQMTADALAEALAQDDHLDDVIAIVATAGTTNAGIVDDLQAAADTARAYDWWFHVDAAYGGAGLIVPELRPRYAGIEFADSIVMDPHKWWFAPYDSAALVYRDPYLAKAVHTQDASYLDVIHTDDHDLNPSDLAFHLTRRPRGLPLWFSMAVNGLDAYRDAVRRGVELAEYAAELLRENPNTELVVEPQLSVILFRRKGWAAADYIAWGDRLLQEQQAFVTPSAWQGETVGRLVFLHPGTTNDMVRALIATLD